jgi:hypothetical protein
MVPPFNFRKISGNKMSNLINVITADVVSGEVAPFLAKGAKAGVMTLDPTQARFFALAQGAIVNHEISLATKEYPQYSHWHVKTFTVDEWDTVLDNADDAHASIEEMDDNTITSNDWEGESSLTNAEEALAEMAIPPQPDEEMAAIIAALNAKKASLEQEEAPTNQPQEEDHEKVKESTPQNDQNEVQNSPNGESEGSEENQIEVGRGTVNQASLDEELVSQPDGDEDATPTMSGQCTKYRKRYVDSVSASNRMSKNNGDELSRLLAGATSEAVMKIAEIALDLGRGFLLTKYENMNNGQQRMNSGNRLRAALKKGTLSLEQISKTLSEVQMSE